jgi:hypothetical protein
MVLTRLPDTPPMVLTGLPDTPPMVLTWDAQ